VHTRRAVAAVFALANVGQAARAQSRATVYGIAYDSLRAAALDSAFIMVAGRAGTATTDASGRFRFDSLPPGTYTFVIHHPSLDSIGFSEWLARSSVKRDGDTVAVFVPSFSTLWSAACGTGKPPSDSGLVFGTLRAATTQRPVAGARVSLSWIDVVDSKTGFSQRRIGGDVQSDSHGAYTVCGVPLGTGIRILASTDSATTGILDLPPRTSRVQRRDLLLGATAGRDSALRGAIAGVLRDAGDRPVPGARVSTQGLAEVRSDADGRFLLRRVPVGTRQVDVVSIGTMPVSAMVDVLANDTTMLDLRLSKVAALDTMRVRATTVRQLRLRDIEDRKKQGFAHFMDSSQVERHADVRSAVTDLTSLRCPLAVLNLYVDGSKIGRRAGRKIDSQDVAYELRSLKPDEVGILEWYTRGAPPEFGGGGCTLLVWTKRYLPH